MADENKEVDTEESRPKYAKNKADAVGALFDEKLKSNQIQREDAKNAEKQNIKAAENEWWVSKLGGWGSAGMAFMLGVANPFYLAAIAAGGSYFGGKKGAENVGGYADAEDIRMTTFGRDTASDTKDIVSSYKESAEDSRLLEAGSTAFSVYNLAGGPIPGTSSWTSKTDIALADNLNKQEAFEALTKKGVEGGLELGAAENIATSRIEELFNPVKGIAPSSVNIPELGGLDVSDISNMDVLWENFTNPNMKGGMIKRGSDTATLFDLLNTGYDFIKSPLEEEA